jgi:hypothetical protein
MPIHPQNPDDEHTPSTTWRWQSRRVKRPPAGQSTRASAASAASSRAHRWGWAHFPRYSEKRRKEWLTLRVKYTGGAEAWYLIEARGSKGRFPGYAAIHDVMDDIYGGWVREDKP